MIYIEEKLINLFAIYCPVTAILTVNVIRERVNYVNANQLIDR